MEETDEEGEEDRFGETKREKDRMIEWEREREKGK